MTKYAFEVVEIPEDHRREHLREICDPAYTGPTEPADILAGPLMAMPELRELVIVDDDGKVIYDGAV